MTKLEKIYLHTGSNLGDKTQNLAKARALILENIGEITAQSAIYETEAWGVADQPDFVNQALEVHTTLTPNELITQILNIEKEIGRIREQKWTARIIDIDVLFYGDQIIKTEQLNVPHPFLHERNFVLIPLLEIAKDFVHPELQLSIRQLFNQTKDSLKVKAQVSR